MVHEINNPLCVISSNAEEIKDLLDAKRLSEKEIIEIREYVDVISEAVKRIANYVDDMLRFIGKHQQVSKETIEINSVVKTIIGLKKMDLKRNNIKVATKLTGARLLIKGVKHQIEQVFLNLINNAEYAMRKHMGKGTLTIITKKEGNWGIVEINDTGPGIPEDILQSIFDSFFTTKPPGEGTGLGLAIVKNIVKEHNGTVEVRNRKEGGAVFIITFPVTEK
ncbi:MAG: HAMP domain-containing histidine kinase [Nitrospirae bacterium]|nr:HAMP domain-containing histidine kinase [Nitrospirota bacterium]